MINWRGRFSSGYSASWSAVLLPFQSRQRHTMYEGRTKCSDLTAQIMILRLRNPEGKEVDETYDYAVTIRDKLTLMITGTSAIVPFLTSSYGSS